MSSQAVFQIFIQVPPHHKHRTITLDVTSNTTIDAVKAKIEDKEGIPSSLQCLSCYGRQRRNGTLEQCNIQQESTLRLDINYKEIRARADAARLVHKPDLNTCPFMKNGIKSDQKYSECAVYLKLMKYQYSEENLQHMQMYNHCDIKRVICKYGVNCNAYKRLVGGGHRLDDRCHIETYVHPPRVDERINGLPKGFNPFVSRRYQDRLQKGIEHWIEEAQQGLNLTHKTEDELLKMLIAEVKKNGFGNDLIQAETGTSLLEIVDLKLKHPRHIAMGSPLNRAQLLSLILYTGCDCNYDLCGSQRAENYKKWVIFDHVLDSAIYAIRRKETGSYPVYSGVRGCMMEFDEKSKEYDGRNITFFCTFTSTSWSKDVAKAFISGDEGMLIGIGKEYREYGCDVSWISKFPDEQEILFSRGFLEKKNYFIFKCFKQTKQMQYIAAADDNEKLF